MKLGFGRSRKGFSAHEDAAVKAAPVKRTVEQRHLLTHRFSVSSKKIRKETKRFSTTKTPLNLPSSGKAISLLLSKVYRYLAPASIQKLLPTHLQKPEIDATYCSAVSCKPLAAHCNGSAATSTGITSTIHTARFDDYCPPLRASSASSAKSLSNSKNSPGCPMNRPSAVRA